MDSRHIFSGVDVQALSNLLNPPELRKDEDSDLEDEKVSVP